MEKGRFYLLVILICSVVVFAFACAREGDISLSRIKKVGYIAFGISSGNPPYCFYNSKNELVGYNVDFANEVAKRLGVKARFVDTEWKDIITNLNAGMYDCIVSSMSVTDERLKIVDFSIPYYYTNSVVMVRKDSAFKTKKDLSGRVLGIKEGTTYDEDAKILGGSATRTFKTVEKAIEALQNKVVDGVITDEIVANYLYSTKKYNIVVLDEHIRKGGKMAVAFKKGDASLLKKVNGIIKAMQGDGSLKKLSEKIVRDRYN